MDISTLQSLSTLFWMIPIVAYGVFEYQRREQNHKMILLALKYGKEPPTFEAKPQIWQFFTTGFVALILLAGAIGFLVWRPHIIYGGKAMYLLALLFLLMLTPLLYVLVKDIQAYRKYQKSVGG
jgi:hypothetical protein